MMKMKKLLLIIAALILAFNMTACKDKKEAEEADATAIATEESIDETQETDENSISEEKEDKKDNKKEDKKNKDKNIYAKNWVYFVFTLIFLFEYMCAVLVIIINIFCQTLITIMSAFFCYIKFAVSIISHFVLFYSGKK